MANILFGWPLSSPTLSGGSWPTLTLANLLTDDLAAVARSGTASNADTIINIDHGAAVATSVIALVRHNMRSAATWRIRLGNDATFATHAYDSGTIAVWPEQWATGVLPNGNPNATTRLLTDAQINALNPPRDAVHVFTEVTARYRRIEIFDSSNADGYVQIGRLVDAPRFQPTDNMAVGSELGFIPGTQVGNSLANSRFYRRRPKGRSLSVNFQFLPFDEGIAVVRDMVEQLDQSGQFYIVADPSDAPNLQRQSFLATLRQLSSVAYAAAGRTAVPLVADEVL